VSDRANDAVATYMPLRAGEGHKREHRRTRFACAWSRLVAAALNAVEIRPVRRRFRRGSSPRALLLPVEGGVRRRRRRRPVSRRSAAPTWAESATFLRLSWRRVRYSREHPPVVRRSRSEMRERVDAALWLLTWIRALANTNHLDLASRNPPTTHSNRSRLDGDSLGDMTTVVR
jgi:hypothetical protein